MKLKTVLTLSLLTLAPMQAVAFTGAKLPPADNTPPPPPTRPTIIYSERVQEIAAKSSCASYSWKSRGHAPSGYTQGMALSFARSVCRLNANGTTRSPATLMSQAKTTDASRDAIAHYESTFDDLHMPIDRSGTDTLRALYTLGMGLGMRESSGKYCEGYDTTAGPETSSEAEAGTFQFSYNSIGASSELRRLYDEYKANPSRCLLDEFKTGASCKSQNIVGSGAGADFQRFVKSCPAFSAEYAMTSLRVLRKHYGPINRWEAEVNPSCDQMLADVQSLVEEDPSNACRDLL